MPKARVRFFVLGATNSCGRDGSDIAGSGNALQLSLSDDKESLGWGYAHGGKEVITCISPVLQKSRPSKPTDPSLKCSVLGAGDFSLRSGIDEKWRAVCI